MNLGFKDFGFVIYVGVYICGTFICLGRMSENAYFRCYTYQILLNTNYICYPMLPCWLYSVSKYPEGALKAKLYQVYRFTEIYEE